MTRLLFPLHILCLVLSVPCVNAGWTNLWADETKSDESVLKVEGEEHQKHHASHHHRRQQQEQEHQQHVEHEKYDALGHHSHEGHHHDVVDSAAAERKEQQVEPSGDAPQTPIEYGVDVSFPIHHNFVSTNYPWLPHNVDPSLPTPEEYQNMPLQPLGDRQTFYKDFLNGCMQHYGKRGQACVETESDRIEMSLRQPQSMQVRCQKEKKKIVCMSERFCVSTQACPRFP